ncbi:DUF6602 domain-containing protein [Spelaeicoccus albus]|uniref:DUF6602 domain-containing protein n=1 Tax=Spelaeicoccus albus TaxID=1280376 RepID=A0A7Z0D4M8_9MICO|nr:DUF6602 domain-containing protein [Spelaeicoccus albus]NYI68768.1 hypothetical protein [Spelaeicoccus albus]
MTDTQFDLKRAFLQRQKAMSAELEIPLEFTTHPTAIGDASEANWVRMLKSFLPGRYEAGPIFALDAKGARSEQIDLAIYDRQYSPLWFEAGGNRYVPVESVYAALEVKQEINAKNLEYAAKKIESVRKLHRTSAPIVDIYGIQKGPEPADRPIVGGIVALRVKWKKGVASASGRQNIRKHTDARHLDLGLALNDVAFDNVPTSTRSELLTPGLTFSEPGVQLISFAMRLFRRLQATGTALAVDLNVYEESLKSITVSNYADIDQN